MNPISWTERLRLTVPGPPVGSARPRFDPRTNRTYKEGKHRDWEALAVTCAQLAWRGREPIEGILRIDVVAVLARPKQLIPKRRGGTLTAAKARELDELFGDVEGRIPGPVKPDLDNATKLAWDAVKKGGVIADDSRVVAAGLEKWWAAIGEEPSTIVTVLEGPGGRWWSSPTTRR